MGYNLYIGEAEVRADLKERYARVSVRCQTADGAPCNSKDDHDNAIWPSYSAWTQFTREHGLYPVFYAGARGTTHAGWWVDDEGKEHDGLLSEHPGAFPLTEAHYRAFAAALEAHMKAHGPDDGELGTEAGYDRKRLRWLTWWTRWALDNCEHPTFANS